MTEKELKELREFAIETLEQIETNEVYWYSFYEKVDEKARKKIAGIRAALSILRGEYDDK